MNLLTDPVSATIGAGEAIINITDRLGLLDKMKRKLLKQPDVASAKLETVLIEMSKVYGSLDNSANDYLGLWLLPDEQNAQWRGEVTKLRRFASGRHEAEMRKAKGDCQKVWSIYLAYLQPWFSRVLNKDEAEELGYLFGELRHIDGAMVNAIEVTSRWLTSEAAQTLALVQDKNFEAADKRIQEGWNSWQPAAETMRESMKRLYDLRAAFIGVSGAV